MKIRNPRKTVHSRTLNMLQEMHQTMKVDKEARVGYIAATHYLGGDTVGALKQLGIIRAAGWKWYWEAGKPSDQMVLKIRDMVHKQRQQNKNHLAFKRAFHEQ